MITKGIGKMAQVTSHGIQVDGHYYSRDHAIRNNWFIDDQKLELSVVVVIHPEDKEFIFVYIQEMKYYELARRVTLPFTNEVSKEQYYQKFQSFKDELNKIKKK
jgi:lactam utilization protein B